MKRNKLPQAARCHSLGSLCSGAWWLYISQFLIIISRTLDLTAWFLEVIFHFLTVISLFLILVVLDSRDALHLKMHLPGAAAAKEGDDDDDGRDADEDVGGGVVDVEVKPIHLLPCNILRLQQVQPQPQYVVKCFNIGILIKLNCQHNLHNLNFNLHKL